MFLELMSIRKAWWTILSRRKWAAELGPKKALLRNLGVDTDNGNFKSLYRAGLLNVIENETVTKARTYQLSALGRTIDPILHIASQNLLGSADPRLIPRSFSRDELLPKLNDMDFRGAYSDKNLYDQLVPKASQPATALKCAAGNLFDGVGRTIAADTSLDDLLGQDEDYIIKPSRTDDGEGVAKIRLDKGHVELFDKPCRTVHDLQVYYGTNFLVQKRLEQHPTLAEPHPESINTIRVLTLRWKTKIHFLMAFLRVGSDGSVQDNIGSGGVGVGIDPGGQLYPYAVTSSLEKVHHHPTSHFDFRKVVIIPGFNDALLMCKYLHKRVLHHNLVSWDVAIDPEGNPVFLEYNFRGALWLYQLIVGKPLLGDLSDEIFRDFR